MNDPLFVSYYTPDYAEMGEALRASLDALGLDHRVAPTPSLGSWDRNVREKPAFLLRILRENPGRRIVWVDADAVVRVTPALFWTTEADVAVPEIRYPRGGSSHLIGTLFLSGSEACREFVSRWLALTRACPPQHRIGAQEFFDRTVLERPKASVEILPPSYAFIADVHGPLGIEPVIEHFQASRRLRGKP